jgi:hypothetical protein
MAVETLLNRGINIKDFHSVGERSKNARQKFEELKQTHHYDRKRGMWNSYVNQEGCYDADDQLLSLLIEGMFDTKNTKGKYEALKGTELYNEEEGYWHLLVCEEPADLILSRSQLYAVLIEGMFDKEGAKTKYETLKQTELYDEDMDQWYAAETREVSSHEQLVGILVEEMFDKEEAKSKYEQLKQSKFYNNETHLWNDFIFGEFGAVTHSNSVEQLLSVVVEAKFNKENARNQYEEIKKVDDNPTIFKLLMSIIIEKTLEEEELDFKEKLEPIPEVRRF